MASPESEPSHQLVFSEKLRTRIKELSQITREKGKHPQFVRALVELHNRLQRTPFELGEPLYALRLLRLEIRTAVLGPLSVTWGVHLDKPIVFVRTLEILD